ncbi:MAG: DUF5317 domain-containing protein [Solirubrobacteraceae bacterium]
MILFVLAGLCVLVVPLTGGRLRRLADLELRWLWLAPAALAVQVVITVIAPGGDPAWHAGVHLASYGLIAVFLLANRRLPGVTVIAAGTLCNVLAIAANGGVMPAAAAAQRIAGLILGAGFHNSARLAHPMLLWLGDIIPVPGPLPNVLSPGDCLIFAGVAVLLRRSCAEPAAAAAPAS